MFVAINSSDYADLEKNIIYIARRDGSIGQSENKNRIVEIYYRSSYMTNLCLRYQICRRFHVAGPKCLLAKMLAPYSNQCLQPLRMARRIWTKCKGDVNFRGTSKIVPENSSRTILHQDGNVTGRDLSAVDIQAKNKEHIYR